MNFDPATLQTAKNYTDKKFAEAGNAGGSADEKIVVELPMEYDYLFFGEIEVDAETAAKLVRAAENLQPVYITCLSGGATVVRKCEISLMGSGTYFFECFNVSRGSVFADTLTYNANAGTLLGESYTLSISGTTGD